MVAVVGCVWAIAEEVYKPRKCFEESDLTDVNIKEPDSTMCKGLRGKMLVERLQVEDVLTSTKSDKDLIV